MEDTSSRWNEEMMMNLFEISCVVLVAHLSLLQVNAGKLKA